MTTTRGLRRRLVAFSCAVTVAVLPACPESDPGDATEENAPTPEFRVGPNPAAVAAEVAALRAMPALLAPTNPVGALSGSASVDSSGAAHYSIPIETTPGVRGLSPRIAVGYDSNADEGALGHRFDLAGLSSVARCPRTLADDGAYSRVRHDEDDMLCLDGVRLLLAAGEHGQAGAEYRTAEQPFSRIVLDDDIQTFDGSITVWANDGLISRYGTAPASLWIGQSNGTRIPWRWALRQQCDRWDNCIDYEYEHGTDLGNGPTELRITAALYGGTGAANSQRSVRFAWTDRLDPRRGFRFGADVGRAELVSQIDVFGPGAALVRSYRFEYGLHEVTGRSRLDTAALCDAAGVCLPATTFEWTPDADTTLALEPWDGAGLPATQAALLRTQHAIVGDLLGVGSNDVMFATEDPDEPWLIWGFETDHAWLNDADEEDPRVYLPITEDVLPPRAEPLGDDPFESFTGNVLDDYLAYVGAATPEMTLSLVDFNGDALDDVLIPVRDGWPALGDSHDAAGVPYAQQVLVASPSASGSFATHYIDDGSDDPIYTVVPLDHDGDGLTDLWMCRGNGAANGNWVFAHAGPAQGEFGYRFVATELECSAFDELSIASVDGGPASLLVIPATDEQGDRIASEDRDAYQRLTFDVTIDTASMVPIGLPRDRYQREHDRLCRNGFAMANGAGPVASAGIGLDRHFDLNEDGLADVLRFELASGDGPNNGDVDAGLMDEDLPVRLAGSNDWSALSACGDDDDLEHDAVLAVYWNTGAGYVRGPNALDLDGNAHAQLWLNVVGAAQVDFGNDGRIDLLLPATGPGSGWTRWEVDAAGGFRTDELPGDSLAGWPAYDDDDWHEALADAARTRILMVGSGAARRPDLWFIGEIEASSDFPGWVNAYGFQESSLDDDGADRVRRITDGLGQRVRFEYRPEFQPARPDPDWPKAALKSALWTTTEKEETITQTDPADGEAFVADAVHATRYAYRGAAFDRGGRGFLGYEHVATTERDSLGETKVTLTTYDQTYDPVLHDYPAVGKARERQTYVFVDGDTAHLEREWWTWATRRIDLAGGTAHFSYAAEHREVAREVTGPDVAACDPRPGVVTTNDGLHCPEHEGPHYYRDVTTTEVRDDFGTLVTSIEQGTQGSDVIQQVDQTGIHHDTDAWLLSQVGRTTVTSCGGGQCEARVTEREYDVQNGAISRVVVQPGDPHLELSTTFLRDPHGNVTSTTQVAADGAPPSESRTTGAQWDAEGVFPLTHVNEAGHVAHAVHDPASGALIAEVDPAGLTIKRSYDGLYRAVGSALHASPLGLDDGGPTTVEYLPADPAVAGSASVIRTTTTAGPRATEYYSAAGDLLERRSKGMAPVVGNPATVAPGADVYERFGYDQAGRHVARSVPQWLGIAPAGWHRRTLDGLDRPTRSTAPDGVVMENVDRHASGVDNLSFVEHRSSQGATELVRSTWVDGRGRVAREVDADGVATCFEYGAFDQPIRVERNCHGPGARLVSTTEYDALGHAVTQVDPHLGTRSSVYDGLGQLLRHTDGAGRWTTYDYDAVGRLRKRSDAEGSDNFGYDTARLGALDSDTSTDAVLRTFEYDSFGRLSAATTHLSTRSGNDAYRFEQTYAPGSRVDTIRYPTPDGEPAFGVAYLYDELGNLRIAKDLATNLPRWRLLTANPSGMALTESYGDGTGTTRVYDPERLWVDHIVHGSGGGNLAQLSYTWTPEGELLRRQDVTAGQTEVFDYDRQWRLRKATLEAAPASARSFTYDVFGNLTSVEGVGALVYDGNVQLTSVAGAAVTHDSAGNMLTHGTRSMTYTSFGKVKTVAVGVASMSMAYDAAGNRVRRRQSNTLDDVVTLDKLYERRLDKPGNTVSTTWRVAAGERIVAQVVRTKAAIGYDTSEQYLHDDAQGSTTIVTATTAQGPKVVARTSNDPWGRARIGNDWKTWASDAQAGAAGIGFTGHRAELDHGLIDFGGRMYDPRIGRFTSPDPLVVDPYRGAAYNRYSYVGNRPLRFTDPSGWAPAPDDAGPGFGDSGGQAEALDARIRRQTDAMTNAVFGNSHYEVRAYDNDSWFGDLTVEDLPGVSHVIDYAIAGREHLEGLAEGAKIVAADPVGAAKLMGQQVVDDAKTVGSSLIRVRVAIAEGDYDAAARHYWESVKATWSVAAVAVPAGAGVAKLAQAAGRATGGLRAAAAASSAIGATGRAGEEALRALGGRSQVFYRTGQGARFVDQLVSGIAHESKVGYTTLTRSVARQISKDAHLMATRQISGSVWHFFQSPVTGLRGPSAQLRSALDQAGIGIVIH